MNGKKEKILNYVRLWESRCYYNGIPDEVPDILMIQKLAPSWKAICMYILCNDNGEKFLGLQPARSAWYSALKRIEISEREDSAMIEMDLFDL